MHDIRQTQKHKTASVKSRPKIEKTEEQPFVGKGEGQQGVGRGKMGDKSEYGCHRLCVRTKAV